MFHASEVHESTTRDFLSSLPTPIAASAGNRNSDLVLTPRDALVSPSEGELDAIDSSRVGQFFEHKRFVSFFLRLSTLALAPPPSVLPAHRRLRRCVSVEPSLPLLSSPPVAG